MQAANHYINLFCCLYTINECSHTWSPFSINALHACVYIYIRQLSSFRAPKLWIIDLTVTTCHIQYTFLSLYQLFHKKTDKRQEYSKSTIFIWYKNGRQQLIGAPQLPIPLHAIKTIILICHFSHMCILCILWQVEFLSWHQDDTYLIFPRDLDNLSGKHITSSFKSNVNCCCYKIIKINLKLWITLDLHTEQDFMGDLKLGWHKSIFLHTDLAVHWINESLCIKVC